MFTSGVARGRSAPGGKINPLFRGLILPPGNIGNYHRV